MALNCLIFKISDPCKSLCLVLNIKWPKLDTGVCFGANLVCSSLVASHTLLNIDILSTNKYLKNGGWKVALSPYYASMNFGEE